MLSNSSKTSAENHNNHLVNNVEDNYSLSSILTFCSSVMRWRVFGRTWQFFCLGLKKMLLISAEHCGGRASVTLQDISSGAAGIELLVSDHLYGTVGIRVLVLDCWYGTVYIGQLVWDGLYPTVVIRGLVSDQWYWTSGSGLDCSI